MAISKAKIRKTEKHTVVDAVVDGIVHEGWVLYDGTTVEHEQAALDYLIRSGVAFSAISFDFDDGIEDDPDSTFNEFKTPDVVALPELDAFFV